MLKHLGIVWGILGGVCMSTQAREVEFIPVVKAGNSLFQLQAGTEQSYHSYFEVQQQNGQLLQHQGLLYLPLGGKAHPAHVVQRFQHPNGDQGVIARLQRHNQEHAVVATFGKHGSFIDVLGPDVRLNMQLREQQLQVTDLLHRSITSGVYKDDALVDVQSHLRQQINQELARQQTTSAEEPVIIDTMLLYTSTLARKYPGEMAVTLMNHLVSNANQAFADSRADVQLRLVHTEQVDYTQPDNSQALQHLYDAAHDNVTDASLSNIPALSLEKAPDLIAMIRTHQLFERGNCGIARFPDGQSIAVNISNYGVHGGSDCTGTFTHEVGHNLGAQHQYFEGQPAGSTAYAGAYFKDNRFTTLMGSFGTGTPLRTRKLHNRFSSPLLTCAGEACGDADTADNVRIIKVSAPQIAARQESKVTGDFTPLLPLTKDTDGDGVVDDEDAFPFDASEQKDSDNDGQGDNSDAFPNDPQEQLDTDGDGIGNNADGDDDNDGVADSADAFPLDKDESQDADSDGYGDNRDKFNQDPTEQFDADEDGIGNRADIDDDNDGVADYAEGKQLSELELWVLNAGSEKLVRLDGETGELLGEVLTMQQGAISFRSQSLAYDPNQFYFLAFSDVYGVDRQQNSMRTIVERSALADNFSGHLLRGNNGELLLKSGLNNTNLRLFSGGSFQQLREQALANNSLQDLQVTSDGHFWAASRNQNALIKYSLQTLSEVERNASAVLNKPEQLALTSDNKWLLSNADSTVLVKDFAPFVDTGIEHISCLEAMLGRIYLCDRLQGQIQVRDENSGALLSVINTLPQNSEPVSIAFLPKVLDSAPFDKTNDTDNDGVANFEDTLPLDPSDTVDTDGDGQVNNTDTDDDNDGMPDVFEIEFGLNALVDDSAEDADGDGVTNLAEFQAGTNPIKADAPAPPPPPPTPTPPTPEPPASSGGGGSLGGALLLLALWGLRRKATE